MLIAPDGQWKHGTFLFDAAGALNPHFRGLAFLAEPLPTAEAALETFMTRDLHDPQYKLKGHFILKVIDVAGKAGSLRQPTQMKEMVNLSIAPDRWLEHAMEQLPAIATHLLTEPSVDNPEEKVWRKSTFLHDFNGNLTRAYQGLGFLIAGKSPKDALAELFTRPDDDLQFRLKGHFLRDVIKAGNAIGSIPNASELLARVSIMPPRGEGRGRA
jgi:hypothetical protein